MEQSRLYRSKNNTVIGGVCGGIGQYLNIDPIFFRILFVLGVVLAGSGLLAYIILWIVIPLEPILLSNQKNEPTMSEEKMNEPIGEDPFNPTKQSPKNNTNLWGGVILIAIGGIFLIDRFVPRIDFGDLWPVILIVIGGILISKSYINPKKQ
jgi:phage shock protein PspC (stress-responsive transcriptional regulator)